MPFPITETEILKTEKQLGLTFPRSFRNSMIAENGGEILTDEDSWELFPFLDTSDRKRFSRTCNDIVKETESAKEWKMFPENAIAIASNGCGDFLLLRPSETDPAELGEKIFAFWHEKSLVEPFAESFEALKNGL